MEDRDRPTTESDRVADTVRHALRLVGPAERGVERGPNAGVPDRPAA